MYAPRNRRRANANISPTVIGWAKYPFTPAFMRRSLHFARVSLSSSASPSPLPLLSLYQSDRAIEQWMSTNKFKINTEKTKFMMLKGVRKEQRRHFEMLCGISDQTG